MVANEGAFLGIFHVNYTSLKQKFNFATDAGRCKKLLMAKHES